MRKWENPAHLPPLLLLLLTLPFCHEHRRHTMKWHSKQEPGKRRKSSGGGSSGGAYALSSSPTPLSSLGGCALPSPSIRALGHGLDATAGGGATPDEEASTRSGVDEQLALLGSCHVGYGALRVTGKGMSVVGARPFSQVVRRSGGQAMSLSGSRGTVRW